MLKHLHRAGLLWLAISAFSTPAFSADTKTIAPKDSLGIEFDSLDRTVNPCEDFYQFSCGGWRKANPLPADKPGWNRYSAMAERNRAVLHDILEQLATAPASTLKPWQQQIADDYSACMDESTINKLGAKPLDPLFAQIDAIKTREDLAHVVASFHSMNIPMFFNFEATPDLRDARRMVANVDQGGLGLPDRDYYFKTDAKSEETRKKYSEHIAKMMQLLGSSDADAQKKAATIMKLETALADSSLTRVARRDPKALDHTMPLKQFETLDPANEFTAYFSKTGAPAFDSLNVSVPDFFARLNKELTNVPLADWKTYMKWHVVRVLSPSLAKPFVDENFAFYSQYLSGVKEQEVRWKRCTRAVDLQLGDSLGRAYVDKEFGKEGKARAKELVEAIRNSLAESIRQADWMTDATKQKALVKLAAIHYDKLGYPDEWKDYSSIKISRSDYVGDRNRANEYEVKRDWNKIGKPTDRKDWGMTPPTVNAYYDPQHAEIVLPAGILQPPMFSASFEDAVNFGAVGRVVGHEMTHGFDDEGRQFDSDGNLADWWTPSDAKAFEARSACIADQYSNYVAVKDPKTGEEVKLNGKLTLGENVADNGGVRMSFFAYQEKQKTKPAAADIGGFNPDQRFFIAYAQSRCENLSDSYARMLAQVDPHSPGHYRAIGPVVNMPEFWKAFGCKKGQPMVSDNACRVW
ncbi:MAG: M13 family metallopeptidase [Burkholderiales bacterium]